MNPEWKEPIVNFLESICMASHPQFNNKYVLFLLYSIDTKTGETTTDLLISFPLWVGDCKKHFSWIHEQPLLSYY